MPESWVNVAETLGVDLHLDLGPRGGRREALIDALREAIRSERLAPGVRLPPYRSVAADIGLARNTVAEAYAELVAEGWLVARQGSGTRVARRADVPVSDRRRPAPPARPTPRPRTDARDDLRHDLRHGRPDISRFPRAAWLTSAKRALSSAPNDAFGPSDPRGRHELWGALAEYLGRARGVRTSPETIVICSGVAHALELLAGARVIEGLAVEAYGLPFHRTLLARAGVHLRPIGLDANGARTGDLDTLDGACTSDGVMGIRAALLTPAHQFPTGGPLAAERRSAAVDWARRRGNLIIEDDYDAEFRYDRKPIGALQGLDPERVIHLGSISKSLSPALRVGWMVLPPGLVGPVLAAKGERELFCGVSEQLTLADFIAGGGLDRHVRRMRQHYRRRRDDLVHTIGRRAGRVRASGVAAGLQLVLKLPSGTETTVVEAAAADGIALDGLAGFRHPEAPTDLGDGLVVGYAALPDHAFRAAVDALAALLAHMT